MNIRFDGKRALVTGAGRGIGRGIIKKLAECGAECVAMSKTQENLDSLKNEVPGIRTVMVDLADWTATRHALEKIGKIDLLVNNAAIVIMSPFLETTKEDLDKVFDVNFKAVFNVSQVTVLLPLSYLIHNCLNRHCIFYKVFTTYYINSTQENS
ncbi:hypothetical protein ACJMK2_038402 [Sinanodonta woodiana]|uniref:L-xylulose reductase n=1 Tax=Sinanodonta woodiana TaxID=1069815 RepID=A0ABD3WC47_SINWO